AAAVQSSRADPMAEQLARLRWSDEPPTQNALDGARAVLGSGRLLGLPTASGYVLAGRADDAAALARLPEGRRVRAAVGDALAGVALAPLARRLASRYWPGPLVLELEFATAGRVALQRTAHAGTAALVEALGEATLEWVLARDAEGAAIGDPDRLEALHGAALGGLADGGATRLTEAPTALGLGPGRFELLDEGLLPIEDLRQTAGLRILFVCTGNTCRSPMAEAVSRSLLSDRLGTERLADFGFEVQSAGVFARSGSPASEHAVTAAAELGGDLRQHASQPATPNLVSGASRVFCLTRSHLEALRQALPPGRADHVELLDPDGRDVADPVGGSLEDYRACAAQITAAIRTRSTDWA
ncbi:MAG: low molecular weight protein arginine phosphatase, partial [Planctomycetota bacterium]